MFLQILLEIQVLNEYVNVYSKVWFGVGVFEVLGVVVICSPPPFFFFLKWGCRKWNRSWFRGTELAYPFHPFWADTHADFTVWELTYYQVINDTVGKSLGLANQLLLNCWRHYFFWIRTFDSPCPGIRIEADSIGMVLSNRNFALEFIHSDHAI